MCYPCPWTILLPFSPDRTNDATLASRIRRLRNGGQTDRYVHAEFGINSRLDELQAAVLRARLPFLPSWIARRRALAGQYRRELAPAPVTVPPERDAGHAYHLFPVWSTSREALRQHLFERGIETLIHYPVPLPKQAAFASERPAACPVADRICADVLSLPLHPALEDASVSRVASAVRTFVTPSRHGTSRLMTQLASLVLLGYLPGALVFRLPLADRPRRASLPADERVFWGDRAECLRVLGSRPRARALRYLHVRARSLVRRERVWRVCARRPESAAAWSGSGSFALAGAGACRTRRDRAMAVLPVVGIPHGWQGSRHLHERGDTDRAGAAVS